MTHAWHRHTEHGTRPRILRGIGFFNGTVLVNRDYLDIGGGFGP